VNIEVLLPLSVLVCQELLRSPYITTPWYVPVVGAVKFHCELPLNAKVALFVKTNVTSTPVTLPLAVDCTEPPEK